MGIYLTSFYSYLLFHTIAELFTISIIVSIFIITWNTRHHMDNAFLLIIGIAFLFVGIVDTLHLLAYKGMGVFQPNIKITFLIYILITALILFSLFYWSIFPQCYIEGSGLTVFKRVSEYIIAFIFLLSIGVLFKSRQQYEGNIFRLLVAALIIMIAAEIAFADYVNVYGITNMIGHLLIVISFYIVYKAIIETGLRNPFSLLFRNLKQSEEGLEKRDHELDERKKVEQELLEYEKNLEKLVDERTSQLKESYQNLEVEITERKRAESELRALSKWMQFRTGIPFRPNNANLRLLRGFCQWLEQPLVEIMELRDFSLPIVF